MSVVKQLRDSTGLTQKEFSLFTGIPKRTIENWETGARKPPDYMITLLKSYIKNELENFEKN